MLKNLARRLGLHHVKRALWADSANRIVLPKRERSLPTRYLSIAAIFYNEARYLAEWLEFHRLVGVEHAYLYDNGSTDDPLRVLRPFVEEGFASVIPWATPWKPFGPLSSQTTAYAHAILNFGPDWRWMAFIDVDEFLFPVEDASLRTLLMRYEDLPALAAFWSMFGFSGHEIPPDGLVIESYTMRAPFPTHAKPKSIVNPAEVVGVPGPHVFDLSIGPARAFTETRQLIRKGEKRLARGDGAPETNILRLNHYYTRSRSEFEIKVAKALTNQHLRREQKLRRLSALIEAAPVRDETILRFVPELKLKLPAARARAKLAHDDA